MRRRRQGRRVEDAVREEKEVAVDSRVEMQGIFNSEEHISTETDWGQSSEVYALSQFGHGQ